MTAYGGRARLTVADLRSLRRRTSAGELARKAGRRARAAVHDESVVIELRKDLDDIVPAPRARAARLTLEPIDAARLPALDELNRRRSATRKTLRFAADLERGCRGFVALRDGRAVGYYWWADREAAASHRDLRRIPGSVEVDEGEVYGYDLFVLDEARGGNLASELLLGVESSLRELGHRRIWGYVDADNRPARWLYAARRYEATRRIVVKTTLGHRTRGREGRWQRRRSSSSASS